LYPKSGPLARYNGLSSETARYDKSDDDFLKWHKLVEEYTSRRLTFPQDKLPAFAGLAQRFASMTESTYVAGLWKEHIVEDLAWLRDPRTALDPMVIYVAPSFSWASIPSPVNYQPCRDFLYYPGTRQDHSSLVDASRTTVTENLYGQVTGGELILRGPPAQARLTSPTPTDRMSYQLMVGSTMFIPGNQGTCDFWLDALPATAKSSTDDDLNRSFVARAREEKTEPIDASILLLSLYSMYHDSGSFETFLLLGKSSPNADAYERPGIGKGWFLRSLSSG
jgi:hypothetical protein